MAAIRPVTIVASAALMAIFAGACVMSASLGPSPMALVTVLPIAAIPAMRGRNGLSLAMTVSAPFWVAMTAAILDRADTNSLILRDALNPTMLWFSMVAGAGYVLGRGAYRGMSFGITLTAVLTLVTAATAIFLLTAWDAWSALGQRMFDAFTSDLARSTAAADMTSEQRAMARDAAEFLLIDHWIDLSIGLYFAASVLCCTPIAAGMGLLVRLRGHGDGFRVGWMATRTPDWLAWVAIVIGGIWLLNDQVEVHPWLQAISWNGVIAIAAIYWVNGTGLTFYMLRSIGVHWSLWVVAIMVLITFYHANITLAMVGLFDTWADFRSRTDRAMDLARQEKEDNDDDRPA